MIELIALLLLHSTIAICLSFGIALAFVAGAELVTFKGDRQGALVTTLASSAFLTLGLWLLVG